MNNSLDDGIVPKTDQNRKLQGSLGFDLATRLVVPETLEKIKAVKQAFADVFSVGNNSVSSDLLRTGKVGASHGPYIVVSGKAFVTRGVGN